MIECNFSYEEFFKSEYADKLKINNTTNNPRILTNWMRLVMCGLQPIRNEVVKVQPSAFMIITGAFRHQELIKKVFSVYGIVMSNTGHPDGECADIVISGPSGNWTCEKTFNFILQMLKKKLIELDQLIWEKDSNCIHVGYRHRANRNQVLIRTKNSKGDFNYLKVTV